MQFESLEQRNVLSGVLGDVNCDNVINAEDIDLLYAHLGNVPTIDTDLNSDDVVNELDVQFLVRKILGTEFGDVDLNRKIDNTDFGFILGNFAVADVGWAGGDTNGDGKTDNTDFGVVLGQFGFVPFDLPPVFLEGVPANLTMAEGEVLSHTIVVQDPEGMEVELPSPGARTESRLLSREPTGDTFELLLAPDFADAGVHEVRVEARDRDGNTVSGVINLTVTNTNREPVLSPLDPPRSFLNGRETAELTFTVLASDFDFDEPNSTESLTFSVDAPTLPNFPAPTVEPDGNVATFTFTPDITQAGDHEIVVRVTDAQNAIDTLSVNLHIEDDNQRPIVEVAPEGTQRLDRDEEVTFHFTATDADPADTLDFELSAHTVRELERLAAAGTVEFSTSQSGNQLTLRVHLLQLIDPLTNRRVTLSVGAIAADGKDRASMSAEIEAQGIVVGRPGKSGEPPFRPTQVRLFGVKPEPEEPVEFQTGLVSVRVPGISIRSRPNVSGPPDGVQQVLIDGAAIEIFAPFREREFSEDFFQFSVRVG